MNARRVVDGLILIVIGAIFLLMNFGYLSWSAWIGIFRMWPVFLIAGGVSLILRGKPSAWVAPTIVLAAIVIGALWEGDLIPVRNPGQSRNLITQRQPLQAGIARAEIDVDFGGGSIILEGIGEDKGLLASGEFQYSGREPVWRYLRSGNAATIKISQSKIRGLGFMPGRSNENRWHIKVTDRIPVTIDLDAGASEVDFDLSRLKITDLDIDAGAADIEITFGSMVSKAKADIDAGASRVHLNLPKGLGLRVRIDSGLSSNNLLDVGLLRNGSVYTTPGYEKAEKVLDVDVSTGASSFSVDFY